MSSYLPWELRYIVLRYLDIPTLMKMRTLDDSYEEDIKQILLTFHNPLDVVLCLTTLPLDVEETRYTISGSRAITLDFIQRHPDLIDYVVLSSNRALTPDIIDAYADLFDWLCVGDGLSINPALIGQGVHPQSTEVIIDLLRRHHQRIDWSRFTTKQRLTLPLLRGIEDYIIWLRLSSNKYLTLDIIDYYNDRLRWNAMIYSDALTREILIKYHHRFTVWGSVTDRSLRDWPELIVEYPNWPWEWQ